jgi:hypothetical protein
MCTGTEFCIMDAAMGVFTVAMTYFLSGLGLPWYMCVGLLVSAAGWFTMSIYFFVKG